MERNAGLFMFLALAVLVLAGALLRLYGLGRQSFWIDEAFSVTVARAILSHGYPLLDTGVVQWSWVPAQYMAAAGLAMFDDVHVGARFASALCGILLIPVFFWFCRLLTGSRAAALAATALLAFSTYEIAWCRQARGYVIMQLFGFLALAMHMHGLQHGKQRFRIAALFLAFLCPLFHPAGFVYTLGVFFQELGSLVRRHSGRALILPVVLAGAFALLAVTAGLLLRGITGPGSRNIILDITGHIYILPYSGFLWSVFGPILLWTLAGAAACATARFRQAGAPILVAALLYLSYLCVFTPLYHHRYLVPLLPLIPALAALGLAWIVRHLWTFARRPADAMAGAAIALFVVSGFFMDWNVRPYEKYYLGSTEPQPDWRSAFSFVAADAANSGIPPDRVTTASIAPVFHPIYIGNQGRSLYLPFSLSGRETDVRTKTDYLRADPVASVADLLRAAPCYVVMDDMSMRLMQSGEIRAFLESQKPAHAQAGIFPVYVWKIMAPPMENNIDAK